MLIRVILHEELISAMKTAQNPTIFVKNAFIKIYEIFTS